LANFAQAEFALSARQEDGETLRTHLQAAWQQTGREPQELADAPPMPPLASHLWASWSEIRTGLESGGLGLPRITWAALHFWQSATGSRLEPWERRAILKVDGLFLEAKAKDNKPTKTKPGG